MGLLTGIARLFGRFGRKLAVRSRWLAKRLWVVMLADVALATRRHWKRLEPDDRRRLFALARKSEGRPGRNLTERERREASELLDKLGHIEYAGSVAGIVLPFRPLSSLATRLLERRRRKAGTALRADGRQGAGDEKVPPG
ncbi:MAG TPA: hypothetical protein VE523_04075 [Solirubrobacterales bacterium]|jgi:hypothetical protein|nr:hypothetical protein [Solirubrobacterales bacterium]